MPLRWFLPLLIACTALTGGCGGDAGNGAAGGEGTAATPPPQPSGGKGAGPVVIAGPAGGHASPLPADPARLPLAHILSIARARVPGEVIEVDLDEDEGVPEYEIEMLTPDGRSIDLKIDARNGAIREMDGD